ncbi:hypothetical protein GCM10023149_41700 [Mucilaginibacter gynuensis]|uniref:Streptomycin biosynthesis protein StrF domain-containing protein n=1 Tax=Mucilaginibacter gynuensis TaxID=1302236 RepID=A0ABP8H4S8_9SPHI
MISIIISSVDNVQLNQVTKNIEDTIGVPYEIIATDNSLGEKGICEVYNTAALKAKYDILCFIHEDIIIRSVGWGNKLVQSFAKNPEVGLIGVIGGSYKPLSPSIWSGSGIANEYSNLIQVHKYSNKPSVHFNRNPRNEELSYVACVDGVWLSTTKEVFAKYKFDEHLLKGFHLYDIDYSLTVGQHYKVAVTYDILVEHLSEGNYSRGWMLDHIKLHKKWGSYLPVDTEGFSKKDRAHSEKSSFMEFVEQLIELGFPISTAYKMLWANPRLLRLHFKLFWKLHRYIYRLYKQRNAL